MNTKRRSTTGRTACKRKRRKCDEGKPRCQRCISSKDNCSYEYVEHPNTARFVKRTKPSPRPLPELQTRAFRDTSAILEPATSPLLDSVGLTIPTDFITTATQESGIERSLSLAMSSGTVNPLALFITPPLSEHLNRNNSLNISSDPTGPIIETPHDSVTLALGSELELEGVIQPHDGEPKIVKDYDPEGIQELLFIAPTMDNNTKENTLPFVLPPYSQWTIASIFEPRKVAHALRDHVIEQFSSSEHMRSRTILIANVMSMFVKNPVVDDTGVSIITYLVSEVQENIQSFMITLPSPIATADRQNAMSILDNTLEIMTLHLNARPMATSI
ncbi:hypothetical protein B0J17DRAFT_110878 [Rhizoctonia solani]|nr:hypothetical protein B0J17DRAFT_110878 [Rhizoctonia solani]